MVLWFLFDFVTWVSALTEEFRKFIIFGMKLTPIAEDLFSIGAKWGPSGASTEQLRKFTRCCFYGRPMHAEEITETLSVARSNVSNCLKELQNWNLIRRATHHWRPTRLLQYLDRRVGADAHRGA